MTIASFVRTRDDHAEMSTILRYSTLNLTYARFNYDLIIGDTSIRETIGDGVITGSIDDSLYGASIRQGWEIFSL